MDDVDYSVVSVEHCRDRGGDRASASFVRSGDDVVAEYLLPQ